MSHLPPELRTNMVLMYEGCALKAVGDNGGAEVACEIARCNIDGAFNALIRMEGAEAAAEYAFALADRVSGRIKAPTAWPPVLAPTVIEPAKVAPPKQRPGFWSTFLVGWLLGLAMGLHR